jgi:hypothetical protein
MSKLHIFMDSEGVKKRYAEEKVKNAWCIIRPGPKEEVLVELKRGCWAFGTWFHYGSVVIVCFL